MALLGIVFEMLVQTQRYSFFTILTFTFLLYVLFIGYYNNHSITYVMLWLVMSIILDIGFISLQMFTNLLMMPIVYNGNSFLKYVAFVIIIVSIVLRVVVVIKLFAFK